MIQTGIESRVKIQDVISSQLPNFILDESPKTADFLKQYYISQEYQSGVVDIAENLDQYLNLDNLTPEVVAINPTLSVGISTQTVDTLSVSSTKGFPSQYGLLKIDNEIITYTGLTTNTFTGLTRGFSGISSYHTDLNDEELIFNQTNAGVHTAGSSIQNLSTLFLNEFYDKFKRTFAPGFENLKFESNLNVGNFLKEIKSFYESKGTDDAIKILFRVLYGVDPKILNLEDYLFKPSAAEYLRRETVIVEVLSGNPIGLVGQTIRKIEKLNDPETQASVSEVEPFTRQGKQYYKLSLFIGYGGASLVEGNFKITPSSKIVEETPVGSSVITVDSTIGFPQSGSVLSGINTISYSDKSINQFFGCTGATTTLKPSDSLYSDEIYFGFEQGDISKKVEFRITGILSKFKQTSENVNVSEGDIIGIKNLGVKVFNPSVKNRKEVFANSWIYNTSSFFEIDTINSSTVTLKTAIDRSTLKVGDYVEFVDRNNPSVVVFPSASDAQPYVSGLISDNPFQVTLNNIQNLVFQGTERWNLRKKLNKPQSTVPISFDGASSDVTNVYFDSDNGYAASNSLPSKLNPSIPTAPFFENINAELNQVTVASDGLKDLNPITQKYQKIEIVETETPFVTGDEIFYESTGATFNQFGEGDNVLVAGISTGSYFVQVLAGQQIKLYSSRSFITGGTGLELDYPKNNAGVAIGATHTFTLYSQRSKKIQPKKSFKKFSLSPNLESGGVDKTIPGTIGKLINGVEIFNYKSNDKIYFGALTKLNVLSGGSEYDVINPPKIVITDGSGSGALAQPCVKGSVVDVLIDPLTFDIDSVVSIGITGGNGSGAVLEPIIGKRSRELPFDAKPLDTTAEASDQFGIGNADGDLTLLTFKGRHNLNTGDRVIYKTNGNASIGQTSAPTGDATNDLGIFATNHDYFVKVINSRTIRFFRTQEQAFSEVTRDEAIILRSINAGTQKIVVGIVNNTILGINVISPGQDYENRKLFVQPTGISTIFNQVTFENHNFKDGDKIIYEHHGTAIGGLSTAPNQQYLVKTVGNNSFKLSNAGLGGTSLSNYNQSIFVDLQSTGIGTQTFKYPDIEAFVEYVGIKTASDITSGQQVQANITPIVRGQISDVYLYEKGSGYGSNTLNFEQNPNISLQNGSQTGSAKPEIKIIINPNTGGLDSVSIGYTGSGYFSTPTLTVEDSSGLGIGAKIRPIMYKDNNGNLTGEFSSFEIVSAGIGYSESTTKVKITPTGKNAVITANVRELHVNNTLKYGENYLKDSLGNIRSSRLEENDDVLQNVVSGYSVNSFNDDGSQVSGIIGWAYDGNPIYGPYGFSDPEKKTNSKKLLVSGYEKTSSVINRPSDPADGFFVEDYVFTNNGDLDEFNGRFEINDDFPNGVYAYHATVDVNGIPQFPYFIGDKYRSKVESDNFDIDQTFNFSSSSIRRNTLPYNVSEVSAGNDFLTEADEIQNQKIEIESVESGSINSIEIVESGTNQKVGDILNFDNSGTDGDGLVARVESIKGVSISSITSNTLEYNDSVITQVDNDTLRITPSNNHNIGNGDLVVISGLTTSLSNINGSYIAGVSSVTGTIQVAIDAQPGAATTEIYTDLASKVSIGNTLVANNEIFKVLNTYSQPNIITVQRGLTAGVTHGISTSIYVVPDSFTIKKSVNKIKSTVNQQQYFNPLKAVGYGSTTGKSITRTFRFGATTITRNIPVKGIYLENHPFITNQKIRVTNDGNALGVSNTSSSTVFAMPNTIFTVRKNKNVVGIKTLIGGPEVFLYDRVGSDIVSDSDKYLFESTFVQEKVDVKNIKNTVSLGSSFHQLKDNDLITLDIEPDISSGIGTLPEVTLRRDSSTGFILADPVQCFATSGISLSGVTTDAGASTVTLHNHRLKTGDKIKHFSTPSIAGIGYSSFFVSVINDDKFNLCDSYENATANPPVIFDINAVSGIATQVHTFEKINPQIFVEKNNNLVFNISDTSFSGYELKFYHDREFKNEFVSTGSSTGFNIPLDATTKLSVGFGKSLPDRLYYGLERLGVAVTADNTVSGYSEIVFVDSVLKGTHKISNVGVSTFTFDSLKEPIRSITTANDCNILRYSTKSGIVTGAINSVNIITGGSNYKKLPSFVSVGTTTINDVNVLPKSQTIGNIKKTRIINEGFEYSSDPTLQPEALIPSFVQLRGSKKISSVDIVSGGSNYLSPPTLVVVDTETGRVFENSALNVSITGSSIDSVSVEQSPSGLSVSKVGLFTTENSNGVSIQKVESYVGVSTFVVSISKPAGGYTVKPFSVGDSVFIEGLQPKAGIAGSGFNSTDYGFKFFPVTAYNDSGTLDQILIDVSQYTTDTGEAIESVDGFAEIINSKNYPSFRLNLVESGFTIGEKIIINNVERDLTVVDSGENFVKLIGLYDLKSEDVIEGASSRNTGIIKNLFKNEGEFEVNYSLVKDLGWETNVGKLNEDIQVLANNDYYQNLSYSIKSPITWNELKSPVNNLVHTSGFKNFADTGISSTSDAFPVTGGSARVSVFLDILPTFLNQVRVDTLYNFDNARDIFEGFSSTGAGTTTGLVLDKTSSKFIQLENKKLTDFIEAKTNNVLNIDDISSNYSNLETNPNLFTDLFQIESGDGFNRVLAAVRDTGTKQNQIVELVVLNNNDGVYILEKNKTSISNVGLGTNSNDFTKFTLDKTSDRDVLKFTPFDQFKFDVDYDVKLTQTKFNSTLTGIGTSAFGLVKLFGSVANVGTGVTTIISTPVGISSVLFVNSQVTDLVTNEMNFVETLVGTTPGDITFMSQSFFDSNQGSFSNNFIGTFGASLSSGVLSLNFTNSGSNNVRVRSSIIGFSSTTEGTGSYRFLASGQANGSERTQLVESKHDTAVGITTIGRFNKNTFSAFKSTVSVASTFGDALHQVFGVIHLDVNDTFIINQNQFLSGGTTANPGGNTPAGIGTFRARFIGSNLNLEFIPDIQNVGLTTVKSLNEVFYRESDEKSEIGRVNSPLPIVIGQKTQTFDIKLYNSLNGNRINRRDFELTSNSTPIFAKTFDPSDTSIVNLGTGKFSIDNHFFRTGEELIYTPQASFVGVGSTPMMYKHSVGFSTALPSTVFAIRESDDIFSISTTRAGTAVTFMDIGEGNNHQFAMSKSLTKALITVDGLVQHPIAQTNLVYQLASNTGGTIGTASTIFSLSGISTINIEDVLKVDDEFIRVTNVGLGEASTGPISGLGTFPLINGQRGYVGTSATNYTDGTNITLFRGAYNIVGSEIHFTEAPRGNTSIDADEANLPPAKSDFEGRVYLRNDYSTNRIYDDISNQFTGIGQTFELKSGGISTTGIGDTGGNGILFINNIFQRPSTLNNTNGNYAITDDGTSGVTTVTFAGVTEGGILVKDDVDINENELPRGGVIVSLGSTGGLGYAPLIPAKVKPQLTGFGTITSLVGVAYSGSVNGITTAAYDNLTGLLDITTVNKHNLRVGYNDEVLLTGLNFACTSGGVGIGSGVFPDGTIGDKFSVVSIASTTTFTTQVGTSTIPHAYTGGGFVREWYGDLTFGSGYSIGVTTDGVSVGATVFDPGYEHVFASAVTNAVSVTGGASGPFTPSDASYDPVTGDLVLFINGHGLTGSNTVTIAPTSISFTCSKDDYSTNHAYPRSTDPAAGSTLNITSFTTNSITVNVGKNVGTGAHVTTTIGKGGVLSFVVAHGGTNYKEPEIFVPSPSYDDMAIEGVSRVGFGTGPDTGIGALISVDVGSSGLPTGIGSTLFSVKNFELSRTGYNFRKGDKFTPVGLVTEKNLARPVTPFILEIEEVYEDNFSSWQFGEFDFVDSIKSLQDGKRTLFPIFYNGELLSIQPQIGSDIIAQNLLLIFVNGVNQKPGVNYQFEGGTTFAFTTPPNVEDDVAIYFYKGTSGTDSIINTDINKILEEGDDIQLIGINTTPKQNERTILNLTSKDRFETNLYNSQGINDSDFRPMHLYKQKVDRIINSRVVAKTRDSIAAQIFPTAKIIADITTSSGVGANNIYVDDIQLFNYEHTTPDFPVQIISNDSLPVVGSLTANVAGGVVTGLNTVSGGSGYTSAPTVSISAPPQIGVGVGTTATATLSVSGGVITGSVITNAGLGYTVAPTVLVNSPTTSKERTGNIGFTTGFTARITSIVVGTGGTDLTFTTTRDDGFTNYTGLEYSDYVFVNNTTVGHGVTSRNIAGSANVCIGSTFFDNVYQVFGVSNSGVTGTIRCRAIASPIDVGTTNGANLGTLSFGKLSQGTRGSNPISITVTGRTLNSNVGFALSTFPTIQRVGGDYTLRNTGALPKTV